MNPPLHEALEKLTRLTNNQWLVPTDAAPYNILVSQGHAERAVFHLPDQDNVLAFRLTEQGLTYYVEQLP